MRKRLSKLFAKIGRADVWPHILRHFNTTRMAELGIDDTIKKSRLGHSCRADITQYVYTHLSTASEALATEKISKALLDRVHDEVVDEELAPERWSHLDPIMQSMVCN